VAGGDIGDGNYSVNIDVGIASLDTARLGRYMPELNCLARKSESLQEI